MKHTETTDEDDDEPMTRCICCGAEMLPNEETDYCVDCEEAMDEDEGEAE